jgi:hypothetical protein
LLSIPESKFFDLWVPRVWLGLFLPHLRAFTSKPGGLTGLDFLHQVMEGSGTGLTKATSVCGWSRDLD